MRVSRFRIRTLIAAVAALAVSLAAIRGASELWASALFSLVLGILGASVLAFVLRNGRERAGWLGSALFGWGHLVLVYGPWFDAHVAPYLITTKMLRVSHETLASLAPPRLEDSEIQTLARYVEATENALNVGNMEQALTYATTLARYAHYLDAGQRAALLRQIDRLPANDHEEVKAELKIPSAAFWKGPPGWGEYGDFSRIGQSLYTLVIALAGALLGRGLYRTGNSQRTSTEPAFANGSSSEPSVSEE
jgi:hypothetical protein